MLSGIGRCGQCGGPLSVSNGRDGTRPIKVYACAYHRTRGDAVCTNTLRRPVETVNRAVVDWVKENVLTEQIVLGLLEEVRRRLADRLGAASEAVPELERDAAKLRVEIVFGPRLPLLSQGERR